MMVTEVVSPPRRGGFSGKSRRKSAISASRASPAGTAKFTLWVADASGVGAFDVVAALRVFGDEALAASQIIYVQSTDAVRMARLTARGQPPKTYVTKRNVSMWTAEWLTR
jgi:hypothetical protein